jgi:hypothetical protein
MDDRQSKKKRGWDQVSDSETVDEEALFWVESNWDFRLTG